MLGTNGPIIHATVRSSLGGGVEHAYGMQPFQPASDAVLVLEVDAAPWVPVQEIRIIVNGRVAKTITGLSVPADPFGTDGLVRFMGEVALADVLPPSGDAWLVVEAGDPLLAAADLGGGLNGAPDGIPDTTDNNGDGKIDLADVAAGDTFGPLRNPDPPKDESDPRYHFAQVVTDSFPFAFTNPFVFDRNGNGVFDPPLVKGSR